MKILIDVKQNMNPKENDVIIYSNNEWKCLPKVAAFSEEIKRIDDLSSEVCELKQYIKTLEDSIKFMAKALKENNK